MIPKKEKPDKIRELPLDEQTERELFNNDFGVASGTESTGLLPTLPMNDYCARSYSDIYDIPLTTQDDLFEDADI